MAAARFSPRPPGGCSLQYGMRHPELAPTLARAQISARLQGYEIDPFTAWISRAAVDAVLWVPDTLTPPRGVEPLVGDAISAATPPPDGRFDLVVGNPPYGRIGLTPTLRKRYRRSLYGHANLYGVFTDLALRHTNPGGVVAFLTPTSFLAGSYYQNLRRLLADEAPPVSLDFVAARSGVFDDVLQETLLAVYRRDGKRHRVRTTTLIGIGGGALKVDAAGDFELPEPGSEPWLAPRTQSQARLLGVASRLPARLADWGIASALAPWYGTATKRSSTRYRMSIAYPSSGRKPSAVMAGSGFAPRRRTTCPSVAFATNVTIGLSCVTPACLFSEPPPRSSPGGSSRRSCLPGSSRSTAALSWRTT